MNTNDTRNNESEERSWLMLDTDGDVDALYPGRPRGFAAVGCGQEVIDDDARNIMEGALTVGEMQA